MTVSSLSFSPIGCSLDICRPGFGPDPSMSGIVVLLDLLGSTWGDVVGDDEIGERRGCWCMIGSILGP